MYIFLALAASVTKHGVCSVVAACAHHNSTCVDTMPSFALNTVSSSISARVQAVSEACSAASAISLQVTLASIAVCYILGGLTIVLCSELLSLLCQTIRRTVSSDQHANEHYGQYSMLLREELHELSGFWASLASMLCVVLHGPDLLLEHDDEAVRLRECWHDHTTQMVFTYLLCPISFLCWSLPLIVSSAASCMVIDLTVSLACLVLQAYRPLARSNRPALMDEHLTRLSARLTVPHMRHRSTSPAADCTTVDGAGHVAPCA